MAGQFIKGGLISFMPTFIGAAPAPNVIVFQINPETVTHTWTAAAGETATPGQAQAGADPLAIKGFPGETFAFTLALDANDEISDGATNPVAATIAQASGVYARLAALEMLQFPNVPASSLVGTISAGVQGLAQSGLSSGSGSSSAQNPSVPRFQVPTVLFVWGPERIVPVRVTALTVTEKLFDTVLNPTHAEAQITLRVLTLDELVNVQGQMKTIANAAYVYTQASRQALALANLGDAAASILGMLPTQF